MSDPKPLTRKELAEFLPTQRAIKAFEKLFDLVPSSFEDLEIGVNDASGKTAQALASLDSIASSLELLSSALLPQPTAQEDNLEPTNHAYSEIGEINNTLAVATSPYFVVVDSLLDLPAPVSGVITLANNYTYYFVNTVDLVGNRLVAGQNTTILGASSENCRIKSTGLGSTALITSAWSMPMRNITLEADVVLDLDASSNANQALDWSGVNFTDCATIGTIKTYNNFVMTCSAFLNSAGLTFDGTTGTIAFTQCLFDCASASTAIILPSTLTISRRFRIIYSSFVVGVGETGLSVSASAIIPNDSYILDTVNFSGGGTYTTGVAYSDNKALFVANKGISNSASIGFMTMQANATATTVGASSTDYKVSGTTTLESISQKFTMPTDNRLTYGGAITRDFRVLVTAALESSNNNVLGIYIAKNGTVLTNSSNFSTTSGTGKADNNISQTVVELATNDYLEVFISNETGANNITATYMSMIVEAIN